MPKLLQNRISRTIEAEKLQAIETAIQTILQHLGEATPITNAELTPLSKLGASSKVGADQVFGLLQSAPSFLEPQQSVVEIEKDKVIFEQLGTIRNWLSPVLAWLDREQQLAG
ncbi:MAG: hypothetical protein SFV22_09225, partial [Saprospiraceae bacterium]|nr:hypothetical protein [Saprospiraceae bacterium]